MTVSEFVSSTTGEVVLETFHHGVMEHVTTVHAPTANFSVAQCVRVLRALAVVGVTIAHLLTEVPTELLLVFARSQHSLWQIEGPLLRLFSLPSFIGSLI